MFTRASDRIRRRFEPRFPHVRPHRLRHSFALATLERLVSGYYAQAAGLVTATGRGGGPGRDAAIRDLEQFRALAISRLAAQHDEISRLRRQAIPATVDNVRSLTSRLPGAAVPASQEAS